jgi:MFS family permease
MATVNFVLAAYNVSIVALAVEVGGAARSGLVLGAGGVAMLAGSIMLGARGLPRRRIRVFVIALAAIALGTLVAASRPWLPLLILGSMIGLVLVPVVSATVSTIFHERVPAGMQGRVFGIRFAVGQSLGPVGSFATGFAIANVASPAMIDGNWGDRLLGGAIGVGAERGPALLLVAVAFALAGLAFALSRSRLNTEFDALPAGEHAPDPSSRVEDASDDGGVTVVAPDTVQLPT